MVNLLIFYILAVLGVFVETIPFLLLGALASGLVAAFISLADLESALPRRPLSAVLLGAALGLFFPVGSAGAAPLARRFYRKGFPLPAAVAFWLAAPALNSIALAVTLVLLGPGPLLWGRVALGYGAAVGVGLVVLLATGGRFPKVRGAGETLAFASEEKVGEGLRARLNRALTFAVDDLFDFAPYLLVGSLLAALPRAFLPQDQLAVGLLAGNSLTNIFLVQALAGSLSTAALMSILAAGPLLGLQNLALGVAVLVSFQRSALERRDLREAFSLVPEETLLEAPARRARAYRTFQALMLAALGLYILWQAWEGEMAAYVDARLAPLVILAALGCMAMAQAVLAARNQAAESPIYQARRHRWNLLALGLPVALGLLLNAYGGQNHLRPPVLANGDGAEIGGRGPVTLVFAQAMDPVSVEQRFHMQPGITGRFAWMGDQVQFWPQAPLIPGQNYTVTLDAGASAEDGRAIYSASHWNVGVRQPWVVYLAPMNAGPELWRSRPDGSDQQQLTQTAGRVHDFGVSPDGEWIAYSVKNDSGGIDLWQVDRTGKSSRLLNCGQDNCAQPAIDPRGNQLAYVRKTGSSAGKGQPIPQVRLLNRATGADAPLSPDAQSTGVEPSWSPDGRRLAYYDIPSNGIRVVDRLGGADTILPSTSESGVSWSLDGSRMLYTDTQTITGMVFVTVYEADFTTGVNRPILKENPDVAEYATPDWSPDGEWIVTGVRLVGALVNRQIWMMKPDGSESHPVTSEFSYSHNGYHWSPSGQALVFQRFELNSSSARPQVMVWQQDSNTFTVVAEDAGFPAWMP